MADDNEKMPSPSSPDTIQRQQSGSPTDVADAPFGRDRTDLDRSPLDIRGLLSRNIWSELRTFLAVAKSPSFARAAELLNTSAPTVSRDVKRLQEQVGCQLIVATHSGITLTDAGRKLAIEVARLDYQLSSLAANLRAEKDEIAGRISVSVPSGLAVMSVAPAVARLSAVHAKIQVELRDQVSFLAFDKNQCDVMISLTAMTRADLRCQKVGMLHLIPMASRAYIARHGIPRVDTLPRHAILQCSYYVGERVPWQGWSGILDAAGGAAHHAENSLAYYSLIKSGVGVGLLGNYMLGDRELLPIDLGVHIAVPIYLTVMLDRLQSRPVRAVYDWLRESFSSNPMFGDNLVLDQGNSPGEDDVRRIFNCLDGPR